MFSSSSSRRYSTISRAEVTTDRLGICGLTTPPTSPIGDCHLVAGDLQDERGQGRTLYS